MLGRKHWLVGAMLALGLASTMPMTAGAATTPTSGPPMLFSDADGSLVAAQPDGSERRVFAARTGSYLLAAPDLSPNGETVVFNSCAPITGHGDAFTISTVKLDGTGRIDLDLHGGAPKWSPD